MHFFRKGLLALLLSTCAMAVTSPAWSLVEMAEEAMSEVSGSGVAIVLNDIRITASPTSYLEFTGADPGTTDYERADIRWYGISITGADGSAGSTWSGFCSSGILDLGCPQGGYVAEFAPHDNPLLLRAFDYSRVDVQGAADVSRTVLEIEYPTAHEPYRFSFWGELNVNSGAAKLQVQNIWNNVNQGGSTIQVFQHSDAADPTFGVRFKNMFEADVRMSLNQTLFSPDTLELVPEFDDIEGLYINDYRVFFPLGNLHYQSLIAKSVAVGNGNFVLELTQVPNSPNAYNYHYGRSINEDPTGGYDRTQHNALGTYDETHGYLRMGDWVGTQDYTYYNSSVGGNPRAPHGEPVAGACMSDRVTCSNNAKTSQTDGLFFAAYPGNTFSVFSVGQHYTTQPSGVSAPTGQESLSTINLGDVSLSGMTVHHLKITSLGAN